MIFGKDKGEFDFDSFKSDVTSAAQPLIEAVNKYEPNKKKRKYTSPSADLHESASLFFQAAADTLDQKNSATRNSSKATSETNQENKPTGSKRDKKSLLADNQLKDLKLDKKFSDFTDSAGGQIKNMKLNKKLGKLTDNAASQVKNLKLDKKAGKLADNVTSTVKDAHLDKKLGDVAGVVSGAILAAATNVGGTVKDAHLEKRLSDVGDTVSGAIKDVHIEKRLADVGDTVGPIAAAVAGGAGSIAGNVADSVGTFIKDAKLDKKAATMAENVSGSTSTLLSMAGDKASQTLKDAKLDKRLAQAQIPEKLLGAANVIPGVTVSNPKKAAKQFRKRRHAVLKAAAKQQKELGKVIAVRQKEAGKLLQTGQKDAQKFIKARRKDIETGKISIPFYEPPKKKGFNWGRTGLIVGGTGAVLGGLAANNARIWAAVSPLESKLTGENRYFRSRQGIVFYKEAGQSQEGKLPVVFVHGIGAGNTGYEWLKNFGPVSEQYKSYAYDLLGFGNSDRPAIKYTAEVYIKQLTEFLDEVVKQPAYLVASSLAASYAVQVAYRRPELVHKLVLSSPTGINRVAGNQGVQILPPYLYFLLRTPVIGRSIYSAIASRKYIRSYMENQMFYDKGQVTDEMVEQYYVASHQPGAEYAAFSFFTGLLNAEIGQTLGRIDKPVLIIQGKQDRQTTTEEGESLRRQNQAARLINLEGSRLVPHWEKAEEFNRATLDFLGQPDKPTTSKLSASDKSGVAAGGSGDERKSHEKPDQVSGKAEDLVSKVQDKAGQVAGKVQDKVEQVADKVTEAGSKAQDKVSEVTGKVQDKASDAAGKAQDKPSDAGKNAQDKAGNAGSKSQDDSVEGGIDIEAAAKRLSEKFANNAKQEHAEGDRQLEASGQSDKPKIKPLKAQPKPAGESSNEQQTLGQMDAAVEYQDNINLDKELKEHRETFIGDSDSGAALLDDKDKNGLDDRRMGNQR